MEGLELITAAIGVAGTTGAHWGAKRKQKSAQGRLDSINRDIKLLEDSRQPIVDPYANVKDLSGMIKNEYADLSVATQAAQLEIEEADISLANTLDTIRQMGMGGGSATSLAQEALRSKRGVSASIEKQEAANEKLRAEGAQAANKARMTEAERMQDVDIERRDYKFKEQEKREISKLDRLQSLADKEQSQMFQYQADAASAFTGATSGLAGLGSEWGDMSDEDQQAFWDQFKK